MRRRGRPAKGVSYVEKLYHYGGVVKIKLATELFNVGEKRIGQIIREGVLIGGRRLPLIDRSGLRGDELRLITHTTSAENLHVIMLIFLAIIGIFGPLITSIAASLKIAAFLIPAIVISSALPFIYFLRNFKKCWDILWQP